MIPHTQFLIGMGVGMLSSAASLAWLGGTVGATVLAGVAFFIFGHAVGYVRFTKEAPDA